MPKKAPSKSESLDAMDFIVNVLKEHSKDLNKLISEVGMLAERSGGKGDIAAFERVEEKMTTLQNDVRNLMKFLPASPQEPNTTPVATYTKEPQLDPLGTVEAISSPAVLLCKRWEDFQALASQAKTVSFMYRESDRAFEADALKNNQVVAYVGEVPQLALLLRVWLSRQLEVPEGKVFEGSLKKA